MDYPNLCMIQWQKAVFVLDGLFDNFGLETISDDYVRNYNNVGELSDKTDMTT